MPVTADQIWREWYQPYFDFIARNRDVVRGVSYIDTNWSSQPQWQCTDAACPNGYWGDSRVEANPLILSRFREQVSRMQVATGPAAAAPFAVPDYSPTGRSEAEYADLPQGGSTGIAVYDATASNQRSAIVYANGASIEFDHVAAGRTLGVRWATTTDDVRATVLVNGRARASYAVPNRGSATAWSLSTLGISVPADATVTFRLDSGDVAWIDYITPGQTAPGEGGFWPPALSRADPVPPSTTTSARDRVPSAANQASSSRCQSRHCRAARGSSSRASQRAVRTGRGTSTHTAAAVRPAQARCAEAQPSSTSRPPGGTSCRSAKAAPGQS